MPSQNEEQFSNSHSDFDPSQNDATPDFSISKRQLESQNDQHFSEKHAEFQPSQNVSTPDYVTTPDFSPIELRIKTRLVF